jgi:(p)ppGpp synthase/HD superfamily hydrolase
MPTIQESIDLITRAHAGQTDKAGAPYVGHLLSVYCRVEAHLAELPADLLTDEARDNVRHAALLHDIIEDTPYTATDLHTMGYPDEVVRWIELLTKDGTQLYEEKIASIVASGDLGAILVKLADNEDNSDPARVRALPVPNPARLAQYERSKVVLRRALEGLLASW